MASFGRLVLLICVVLGLTAAGCERRNVPELLTVTDVVPREVHPGDRFDVIGANLPVGQVEDARVIFSGDLYRAGEPPLRGQTFEAARADVERERVSFVVDDAMFERVTGYRDDAKHTTFRGHVEVRLPDGPSGLPVYGTVKGEVVIEYVPRPASKQVRTARDAEAAESLAFLGLTRGPEQEIGSEGWEVRAIRPGSPLERADVRVGDVIEAVDGLTVLGADDLVLAGDNQAVALAVRRGEEQLVREIPTEGYRADSTSHFDPRIVVLLALAAILFAITGRRGAWMSWTVHRLREAIHPHRASGSGVFVSVLRAAAHDGLSKGAASQGGAGSFSAIAPLLVFVGVTVSFAALPFVELGTRAELDVGILYLVPLTALVTMALLTGGWGSSRSFFFGRVRAVLDVLMCQLPAAAALAAIVLRTGSVKSLDVVRDQLETGGAWMHVGSWPWSWNALRSPQLFLLFALFFGTALIDGSNVRSAARQKDAAPRIAISPYLFAFAEWLHIFVMCALATLVFLGGYALPGVELGAIGESSWLKAAAIAWFALKCWVVVLCVLVLRAALPRIRPDLVLRLGLVVALPACIVACGLTLLTVQFPLLPSAERGLGWITLLTLSVVVGMFVAAIRPFEDGPKSRLRSRLNPYL